MKHCKYPKILVRRSCRLRVVEVKGVRIGGFVVGDFLFLNMVVERFSSSLVFHVGPYAIDIASYSFSVDMDWVPGKFELIVCAEGTCSVSGCSEHLFYSANIIRIMSLFFVESA